MVATNTFFKCKTLMTPPLSGIKCPPLEVPYYCVLIDEH